MQSLGLRHEIFEGDLLELEWIVYASVRDEQAWVTPHNGALLLITGDGTEQEFRALAEAVGSAQPVR